MVKPVRIRTDLQIFVCKLLLAFLANSLLWRVALNRISFIWLDSKVICCVVSGFSIVLPRKFEQIYLENLFELLIQCGTLFYQIHYTRRVIFVLVRHLKLLWNKLWNKRIELNIWIFERSQSRWMYWCNMKRNLVSILSLKILNVISHLFFFWVFP